jgi:hypothetical protein
MKTKMKLHLPARGAVMVALALSVGIIGANSQQNNPPCVPSSNTPKGCGPPPASPPDCVETICDSNWTDCSGPSSDLFCSASPSYPRCEQYQLDYRKGSLWGADCVDPGYFIGTTAITCSEVDDEVGGCGG